MRGSKAKALRTPECPNPGRKGGGATKVEVRNESNRRRKTSVGGIMADIAAAAREAMKPKGE